MLDRIIRADQRRGPREPPKSLEDAHATVLAVAKRQIENDRRVRMWRLVERAVYLLALTAAFLLYYLIDKMNEALSLPGLPF